MKSLISSFLIIASSMALLWVAPATAANSVAGYSGVDLPNTAHKVVIHVSSDDKKTQKIALANAVNLQAHYGMDNITIELVAYGPGLSILTKNSDLSERVKSLSQQNITFSACANTIKHIVRVKGKKPELTEGVSIVPAGVARIIELQEQGFSYVRP